MGPEGIFAPLRISGPGWEIRFGDQVGDGDRSLGPAPPRCHPEPGRRPILLAISVGDTQILVAAAVDFFTEKKAVDLRE
ncbi:hypothetical protein GQ55_4G110600 [Panicum hallii var. hallii]|uniref:Uncharacterized protein n=1 Tax=Panicum hallii var. hallii TaxID=1504633 RepID=A0A2T7DXH4_9POAL|nr:hypothetical protein GQ55_4G110600 [Panicum hallii var. hallii]